MGLTSSYFESEEIFDISVFDKSQKFAHTFQSSNMKYFAF